MHLYNILCYKHGVKQLGVLELENLSVVLIWWCKLFSSVLSPLEIYMITVHVNSLKVTW